MCGVCGIVPFRGGYDLTGVRERVDTMLAALAHRGPDDSSMAASELTVLGATRLAIRGLSSGGQPMTDPETGVMVVCNGEIDNHHELRRWLKERGRNVRLRTDVGVLGDMYLELGEMFVERLAGVFAIALWDPRNQSLLLARDRAGERPLFYSRENGTVRFATEIAALASDSSSSLTHAPGAFREYMQFGCLVAPRTPFAEIQKLRPGETIVIDANGPRHRRYWRWNIATTAKKPPSLADFDEVFKKAVKRQSDVDVPYGVFLSGGVDSSLVAAVARRLSPDYQLPAYSLRFRESSYDEGHYVDRVVSDLGLRPISVWVSPEDFPGAIADLVRRVGEPLADPAWVPTSLLARRASQDVKLVLGGEGGDEVFGGYPTYLGANFAVTYARLPRAIRKAVESLAKKWPSSDKKVTVSFLIQRFLAGIDRDGVGRHLFWTSNISPDLMRRLGLGELDLSSGEASESLLDAIQQVDLETTLSEGLLTKADRASMMSAIEVRSPFLDQTVLEFAATLPTRERVRGLTTKYFLKEYALRYLPRSIVHRRKRGLSLPLGIWLRGPLYEWARSRLASGVLDQTGIRADVPLQLLEEHRRREANHARVLWALIVFAEWLAWAGDRSGSDRVSTRLMAPAHGVTTPSA